MINVIDITNNPNSSYVFRAVFRCPSSDDFPSESGCGKIVKQFAFELGGSNLVDLQERINLMGKVQITCPYCNYKFKPFGVYV